MECIKDRNSSKKNSHMFGKSPRPLSLGSDRLIFESQLCHLLAVWFWTHYLYFLSLGFLICEEGMQLYLMKLRSIGKISHCTEATYYINWKLHLDLSYSYIRMMSVIILPSRFIPTFSPSYFVFQQADICEPHKQILLSFDLSISLGQRETLRGKFQSGGHLAMVYLFPWSLSLSLTI